MNEFTAKPLNVTVGIPTYRRPDYLRRAVTSILGQTVLPSVLIVVCRDSDVESQNVVRDIGSRNTTSVHIEMHQVSEPGFLPPIRKIFQVNRGDVVALLDDDAVAHRDWVARLTAHYRDQSVGAVGGRCVNYFNGERARYPPVEKVGRLFWYGRSIGNLYRDVTFTNALNVDFLMGGNCSYRAEVLRQVVVDERLGSNVAFHWELDVGQQVKRLGYRLLFDPAIIVDHHTAPREIDGMRTVNYEGVFWANHNYSYLMKKHLSLSGLFAYVFWTFLVGSSGSPGIARLSYALLRHQKIAWHNEMWASIAGRVAGLRSKRQGA